MDIAPTPYDGDWNNFGPRFGFAWKLLGSESTVVRGGYGIFFAHPFDAGVPNAVALGFSVSRELNSPDNGITAPFYLRDGVPAAATTTPKLDDTFRRGSGRYECEYGGHLLRAESENRLLAAVQSRSPGPAFGVLGCGSDCARQSFAQACQHTAIDQPNLSRLAWSAAPVTARSSVPAIQQRHDSVTDAGARQLLRRDGRFQKRYSKGLIVGANYTWSRFFDNTNEVGATLGDNGGPYSNFYDRSRDYGPSANDIRHRAVIHFVYELPFGTGRKWLNSNPLQVCRWRMVDIRCDHSAVGTAVYGHHANQLHERIFSRCASGRCAA